MTLVTLGTQNLEFRRLLNEVEKEIIKGNLIGKVVVQKGATKFKSSEMELFDYIPMDKLDELIKECDLLITHGGVGSIMSALKYGKRIIATPRLKAFGEMGNDHQLDIIENFGNEGYIIPLLNLEDLGEKITQTMDFIPKKYESNRENFIKKLSEYIEAL